MMVRALTGIVLAACVAASWQVARAASDPTPKGWATYINTKYDFDICTPPTLRAEPDAPAGDGRLFTGPGGGTLRVFWRPGTEGDTLARTIDGEVSDTGPNTRATYAVTHATWAVRSGTQAGQVFYIKTIQRGRDYLVMDVRYPSDSASAWTPMVGHFAACFESSRP